MPRITDCLQYQTVRATKINKTAASELSKLDEFIQHGIQVLGRDFICNRDLLKTLKEKEAKAHKTMWSELEVIPKKYHKTIVPNEFNKYRKTIEYSDSETTQVKLSHYPLSKLGELIDTADKLNMIIVPIDFVNLKKMFEVIGSGMDSYYSELAYKSIMECSKLLAALNETNGYKSQMYILCPLSYYDFWLEVKSKSFASKYYPEKLENIFVTIDLMVPAQRNLYQMCSTNESNINELKENLDRNVKAINEKVKRLESRISNVESQLKIIAEKKQAEEIAKARLRKAAEEKRTYKMLDPVVFFTYGNPVSFDEAVDRERKTHIVSCFGPEFPEEFFIMNELSVSENKRLKSEYNIMKYW